MNEIKERDCCNCEFAKCYSKNKKPKIDCYKNDLALFDHHIINSKEAINCDTFLQKNLSNEELKEWYKKYKES